MPLDQNPTFTEHRVPAGQGKLHVRDYAGTGPTFVLMHGFPDNSRIYDELIPHLVASGRRVVTFDFLGFGASDKPEDASYSFAQQLGDLKAVVDHLDLGKIVPVAHDSSGAAAVNFAIEHPENTASLVILNAAFANSPSDKWPELIELFATPSLRALSGALLQAPERFGWVVNFQRDKFRDALLEKHKARFNDFLGALIDQNFRQQPSAAIAFAQMTAQFFGELTRNTARIPLAQALDIPVKVIWGENDPYLGAGVAGDFRANFKNASLHMLPAGHWLQIDEPALVAREMLA